MQPQAVTLCWPVPVCASVLAAADGVLVAKEELKL
jgi:hypothetical protein